jgi:predicted Zn-dependent protease
MRTDRLVEQTLELVAKLTPAGTEAEVTAEAHTLALTRFANSFIHQNVVDTATTLRLRLHTSGRTASGSTTITTGEGLTTLVERTLAASRLLPPDPGWPGLTPASAPTGEGNYDPDTAEADPAARAKLVRDFIDAAEGLTAAGYCRTAGTRASFGNTAGHRISGASSSVAVDAIARAGNSDGVARTAGVRLCDVDGAALGAVAAAKARAGVNPVDIEPGEYPVVLEPTAVIDIVLSFALWGYNGKAVSERRSFVELGAAQFDSSVNVVDDPLGPHSLHPPFDAEGTPGQRAHLVRDGVSVAVAHDRRTARETGAASTGHALPPGFRTGPFGLSTILQPGAGGVAPATGRPVADDSVAGLLTGLERGLLVSDLWYTRVLDPRTLVITGLTRNGVWLVENGEIVGPVGNLRFTQSYPKALGPGRVRAVGGHAATLPYNWGLISVTAPALLLDSWNFTGGGAG